MGLNSIDGQVHTRRSQGEQYSNVSAVKQSEWGCEMTRAKHKLRPNDVQKRVETVRLRSTADHGIKVKYIEVHHVLSKARCFLQ